MTGENYRNSFTIFTLHLTLLSNEMKKDEKSGTWGTHEVKKGIERVG
jgi:hypothetical protein